MKGSGVRIAAPVCALARNDRFWGRLLSFRGAKRRGNPLFVMRIASRRWRLAMTEWTREKSIADFASADAKK